MRRIKAWLAAFLFAALGLPARALAQVSYPIEPQDATALGQKIVNLIRSVGMPVGGAFLLLGVVIIAVRFVLLSVGGGRREEAMQSLLYVAVGGIILGAALFISGALLGIGQSLGR